MNGLAEAANKKSKAMVTSMLACAQHLTESFWTYAWDHADLLHSLRPSSQPGKSNITKWEAVRGTVSDLNSIVLLPFGQPVEYHVPKDQRGNFHPKSRAGSYIGADLSHPGAIQVWSHSTRRTISTTSFKVKHALPDPDKVFERLMFREVNDLDDTPVTSLTLAGDVDGPNTRGRRRMTDIVNSHTDDEGIPSSESDTFPHANVQELLLQEGAQPPQNGSSLQEGAQTQNELSLQEGAQSQNESSLQEGALNHQESSL
jgi:hypothetical protein